MKNLFIILFIFGTLLQAKVPFTTLYIEFKKTRFEGTAKQLEKWPSGRKNLKTYNSIQKIWVDVDNEKASDYLRLNIGQKNDSISWVVVRPDTLINKETVSKYEAFASPTTSALFKPGKTSRINVGNFMAKLIINNNLWDKWKGQMPVVYNE